MHRLLIDSSVFISVFNSTDRFHHQSVEFFRSIDPQETAFLLPRLVMLEVVNILYRHGVRDFGSLERAFTSMDLVELDGEVQAVASELLPRVALKSADLIIVATARLYQAELVTLDRQLIAQAKNAVMASTPAEKMKK